jgi:hypothetical protein
VLLEISQPDVLVVGWWMVLGEVVCQIVSSSSPGHFELLLVNPVFYPVEAHVDGF